MITDCLYENNKILIAINYHKTNYFLGNIILVMNSKKKYMKIFNPVKKKS